MAKKEKNEVTVVLKSDAATRRHIFGVGVTVGLGLAALAVYALAKLDELEHSCKCGGDCHCHNKSDNAFGDLDCDDYDDLFDDFDDDDDDDVWDDTEAFMESETVDEACSGKVSTRETITPLSAVMIID